MSDSTEVGRHAARMDKIVSYVPARQSPSGATVLYRLEGRRGGNA